MTRVCIRSVFEDGGVEMTEVVIDERRNEAGWRSHAAHPSATGNNRRSMLGCDSPPGVSYGRTRPPSVHRMALQIHCNKNWRGCIVDVPFKLKDSTPTRSSKHSTFAV